MTVLGEAAAEQFAKQHAAARKPLARFLALARATSWQHFPEVKRTFPAADYAAATGTLIFDIGGNKTGSSPARISRSRRSIFKPS